MLTIQEQRVNAVHEASPHRVDLETLKSVQLFNKAPVTRAANVLPLQRQFDIISTQR